MFKDRLIKLIQERGISKYKIAKETMITEATLSNYCNGKVKPSPSIVMQLASYFGVDYKWLLTGEPLKKEEDNLNVAESPEEYGQEKIPANRKDMAEIIKKLDRNYNKTTKLINKLNNLEEKIDLLLSGNTPAQPLNE